jgi:hypothetical protein
MVPLFWFGFWAGLTVLALAAGVSLRTRLRERIDAPRPVIDDEAVEEILQSGTIVTSEDEPLDLGDIDEEERKFWSESWNEPDEW